MGSSSVKNETSTDPSHVFYKLVNRQNYSSAHTTTPSYAAKKAPAAFFS